MLLRNLLLATAASVASQAGSAFAGSVAVAFTINSTDASQVYMTDDSNGSMRLASMTNAITSGDAASPFVGATGDCFGAARMVMGRVSGDGYCAYTDIAGDLFQIHWSMQSTANQSGTWEIIGGTGSWAMATGGGIFIDVPVGDGTNNTHVSGSITVN